MYEDLVERLRTCGNSLSCNKCKWRPECDGPSEAMRKAADAIEELTDKNVGKWIPVTERLPELDKRVFVIGLFGFCGIYSLIQVHDTTCWEDEYGYYQDFEDVTHWMPLPEPPKEET